jgi:hypothetical protein
LELAERNRSTYSTIEGKTAVQLEIENSPTYKVKVKNGKFEITKGAAKKALLCWKVPGDVFREVLMGEHKLMYSILDPAGSLTFDTPNFTHWNGATIIEMLLLACEMTVRNPKILKLVKELEC